MEIDRHGLSIEMKVELVERGKQSVVREKLEKGDAVMTKLGQTLQEQEKLEKQLESMEATDPRRKEIEVKLTQLRNQSEQLLTANGLSASDAESVLKAQKVKSLQEDLASGDLTELTK